MGVGADTRVPSACENLPSLSATAPDLPNDFDCFSRFLGPFNLASFCVDFALVTSGTLVGSLLPFGSRGPVLTVIVIWSFFPAPSAVILNVPGTIARNRPCGERGAER